jgi:transposase
MLASNILPYQEFLKDTQEPIHIRLAMVKRFKEVGSISQVAKEFHTTRLTVRKWVTRFSGAMASLKNVSKAPKTPFRRMSEKTEKLLVQFRRNHPSLGYDYVHHYLLDNGCDEIPSKSSVYAIWRKHDLLPKRYTKHEKKKDLRAIKSKYKPFEKIQIDVKELRDIPNILDQSLLLGLQKQKELPNRYGLPMYQYTARDVKTGALFTSLAYMHNRHTAAIFADRVLTHLKAHGIIPRVIQTDNGSEFVNTRDATDERSLFVQVVTRNQQTKHRRIPPGAKTWQSDVETSHWIIEREFYDVVKANSDHNFIDKLRAYQWGFNVIRKNGYRGNKTPYEIIREEDDMKYATLSKTVLDFPTCILDEKFDAFIRGGYHVCLPTKIVASLLFTFLYAILHFPILFVVYFSFASNV